ncbi:MAG: DUF1902 domain-containing protein [Treponema sp.]|jgi:hypothetical protein|nr:DUF1902 domain-containing protein [Treponema sp.]
MTITQTVEIPNDRKIFLDLPMDLPVGKARITVTPQSSEYSIAIAFDDEAQKWYAQNNDIPIILEDNSLDTLINRLKLAVPEILEMNNKPYKEVKLIFKVESQAVMA